MATLLIRKHPDIEFQLAIPEPEGVNISPKGCSVYQQSYTNTIRTLSHKAMLVLGTLNGWLAFDGKPPVPPQVEPIQ